MGKVVAGTTAVLFWIAGLPLAGYTVAAMWNWFIAPITNWKDIGTAEGFGVYLSINFVAQYLMKAAERKKISEDLEKDWDFPLRVFIRSIALPIGFLLTGWIVSSFTNSS